MRSLSLVAALAVLAMVSASDQMTYNGKYTGQCGDDGLYYVDSEKFVVCSNGEASQQKCAPGSANNDYHFYHFGQEYGHNNFCSINLIGYGYGYGNGYTPYAYPQRFYRGNNYYGYQPYGYYPFAYPFPYFYPMGYPYGQPYDGNRLQAANGETPTQ